MNLECKVLSNKSDKNKKIELGFSGDLTIYEVSNIYKTLKKEIAEANSIRLILSKIEHCDTAGVQLICAVIKEAIAKKKSIELSNISASFIEATTNIGTNITNDLMKIPKD